MVKNAALRLSLPGRRRVPGRLPQGQKGLDRAAAGQGYEEVALKKNVGGSRLASSYRSSRNVTAIGVSRDPKTRGLFLCEENPLRLASLAFIVATIMRIWIPETKGRELA